jgi:hypothetical protein
MKMKIAHVHVLTARGHGPNSLFPHEVAWLELWSSKNADHKIETSQQLPSGAGPLWDENIDLEIAEDEKEIVISMKGKIPSREGIDIIGSGTVHLDTFDTSMVGGKQLKKVPIFASNGKEAGEIDLEIEL